MDEKENGRKCELILNGATTRKDGEHQRTEWKNTNSELVKDIGTLG